MAILLPHYLEDLRRSGLSDETIEVLGFYSGTAAEVEAIVGCNSEQTFCNVAATHDLLLGCAQIKTGRSYHIWVKPRKPIRPQRVNNVEVKCLGSHVLAPPPIYPSGTAYAFQVAPGTLRDFTEAYRVGLLKPALPVSDTAMLKTSIGLEVIR